ncbi:MAG: metal-sensitive transcriptional regulator [Actinobacteria bacterium]|nr:metal-sensitive transcriptional regulator [Actinomycetota bacterium]MBW3642799.1 metal-sensitive transcriptional regulator [Actinomycetota bacterium]
MFLSDAAGGSPRRRWTRVPLRGIVQPGPPSEEASVRGYTQTKDDYLKRLARIEGQVRGLQRMVEEDKYCIDVLTQVAAVNKALQSVAVGLLDQHLRHCVRDAVGGDDPVHADAMVTEATRAIERLVKACS